jgi:hypothetical protein
VLAAKPYGSTGERDRALVVIDVVEAPTEGKAAEEPESVTRRSSHIERMFRVDLRSLAALRVALGFLVLIDILGRCASLDVFYTDEGVLPRSLLSRFELADLRWSFFKLDGSSWFAEVLFAIAAIAAVAMILGIQTRVATVVAWALIVSVQVRNPYVLSGADYLLRVLMFWAMLLPLGAVWSVDARLRKNRDRHFSMSFASLASVGFILQIAAMYWFTAILKSGSTWRTEGTALYYATGAQEFIRPFGDFLHGYPELLRVATHLSLGFEFLVPLLFFSAWMHDRLRIVAVFSTMAFHFGIWLIMDVGLFPWISALCMVGLLPGTFWDRIVPRLLRRQVAVADDVDTRSRPQLQSTALLNGFAAACIVLIGFWNLTTVTPLTIPREARAAGYVLAVDQQWSMFAPNPTRYTRWFIVGGVFENYESANLLPSLQSGDFSEAVPYTPDQPENIVSDYYKDKYWRKYFDHLDGAGSEAEQLAMASYVCDQWNAQHDGDQRLAQLSFMQIRIQTLPDNQRGKPDIQTIRSFGCY